MGVELIKSGQLTELGDATLSMRGVMEDLMTKPPSDNPNLWETEIGSKTLLLYKYRINDPGYNYSSVPGLMLYKFKVDHEFDTDFFRDPSDYQDRFKSDAARIRKDMYNTSSGAEFVAINPCILEDTQENGCVWAMRAKKFWELLEPYITDKKYFASFNEQYGLKEINYSDFCNREERLERYHNRFSEQKLSIDELIECGGFELDTHYTPEEVLKNDFLLEIVVRNNNPTRQDYDDASRFLSVFISYIKDNLGIFENYSKKLEEDPSLFDEVDPSERDDLLEYLQSYEKGLSFYFEKPFFGYEARYLSIYPPALLQINNCGDILGKGNFLVDTEKLNQQKILDAYKIIKELGTSAKLISEDKINALGDLIDRLTVLRVNLK